MLSAIRPVADRTGFLDRRLLVPAVVGWVWARICVGVGFVIANQLTPDPALAAKEDFPLPRGLMSWDAFFYERIAVAGYGGTPPDGVRFFPGYPFLARLLSPLFAGHADLALVVIANLAALAGAVVLARLAREAIDDTADGLNADGGSVGTRTAWIVAVVPAAIVFVWAYSEGLALVATAATLLALHRRAFAWAGAFAAAACVIRPTGLLLLVPIVVELVRCRPRWIPALTSLIAPVLAVVVSLATIRATTGSWTSAFDQQTPIRGEFRNPVVRAGEALWGLRFNTDTELAPYVVLWFLLLAFAVWKRQPLSWILFSAATLLVACSSQTIDSIGRYGLLAVPLVVALAQWADRNWRTAVVGAVGSVGLVLTTVQVLQGRIVP
ncbi:MAG: hypothetical protein KGR17_00010 [Acidobacteria bacterium]|nr:hypothetical protein [Acidobacteriota bacterium]